MTVDLMERWLNFGNQDENWKASTCSHVSSGKVAIAISLYAVSMLEANGGKLLDSECPLAS